MLLGLIAAVTTASVKLFGEGALLGIALYTASRTGKSKRRR